MIHARHSPSPELREKYDCGLQQPMLKLNLRDSNTSQTIELNLPSVVEFADFVAEVKRVITVQGGWRLQFQDPLNGIDHFDANEDSPMRPVNTTADLRAACHRWDAGNGARRAHKLTQLTNLALKEIQVLQISIFVSSSTPAHQTAPNQTQPQQQPTTTQLC